MLRERQRPPTSSPSPFSNTYISDNCDPPKWRCFLKGVSHNHLMITLIPASYHDLKSLLVKRANLSDGENLAVKVIPDSENTLDLDTETNTTDQPIGGPMSEQQVSFESSTSSLTHLTSPSLPPPTPTNSKSNGPAVEETDGLPPRMRYRSGPVVTTQSQPTHPVFSDSVLRERASSFHVNRERCSSFGQGSLAPERSRTGSVDSPTKDPHSDLTVTESPKDPVKRRYVSMPSKSLPGFSDPSVKSMSSEALRNDDGCVPLHLRNTGAEVESVGRGPSTEESQSAVPPSPCHKFLFGAVTLPIYVYDCKLNSIITQLVNREERSYVVGKDIFMDSTFKLEHDLIEDTVPLKDEELPSLSGIQDDNKLPSPEPRSEESDVGVDSSFPRTHVGAVEVCHLRSFVLGVFQSLQKELMIHKQDMEAALNHCHEAVMEIEISHFLQTICGHLRDFRLRSNIEQLHHSHSATPKPQDGGEEDVNGREKATDRVDDEVPSRPKPVPSTRFPLSLLKQHLPCRDLQQLHSMIKERFSGILQGSFRPVPSLPEYYFFSPQSLHRSNEIFNDLLEDEKKLATE
ncbi:uncharacterized protein LOC135226915 [Macrobrachium nipponense]|uniref:uncharacterized protein LOC135226915 n=1 Tax=Macrobrachium nipponense TaxID=159736 RepID=UPI0030C85D6F